MSSTKKTILFVTINAWGHINAWIGIAQELLSRGHRVVWAVDPTFEGKLSSFGFEEVLVGKVEKSNDDKEFWQKFFFENSKYLKEDRLTIVRQYLVPTFAVFVKDTIEQDSDYREVVQKIKPDILVLDRYVASVPLNYSGIPYVVLYSSAPHYAFLHENKIPPPWSGKHTIFWNVTFGMILSTSMDRIIRGSKY